MRVGFSVRLIDNHEVRTVFSLLLPFNRDYIKVSPPCDIYAVEPVDGSEGFKLTKLQNKVEKGIIIYLVAEVEVRSREGETDRQ